MRITCLLLLSTSAFAARPRNGPMNCGKEVKVCGVLALQSGLGEGVYGGGRPAVHGLWPQVRQFGNSICELPRSSAASPKQLFPSCYTTIKRSSESDDSILSLERHEWKKHGRCAGCRDFFDFISQVCSLSEKPLAVMSKHNKFHAMARALENAGFEVYQELKHTKQLLLSACLNQITGRWVLAPVSKFSEKCGTIHI